MREETSVGLAAKAAIVATLPRGAHVPSPCVDVCQIEPVSGLCRGCRRTLDEIAVWGQLHDDDKREVWSRLALRPEPE
jgi:predicted Fe-S protein YdhL (DUF1289 family)